jgi:glycosyltransferase involved in cell wall biosynthesis
MEKRIAVVIPSYRVKKYILGVISKIPAIVWRIYIIDDACPECSGKYVTSHIKDERVRVLYHEVNKGVGGAVMTGYRTAIEDGATIIVKIDGDDQMDASLIPHFVGPILAGESDYTKGNRFFDLDNISVMPPLRRLGNAGLSFMSKVSTGYWDLFDPTNGYTAIHSEVAKRLPFDKINQRFFFETDILFRLYILKAVVLDVPMDAKYGDEQSNLKIHEILRLFIYKHLGNLFKRIFYNYYLRDMTIASVELPLGLVLIIFGVLTGAYKWIIATINNIETPAGTVMLAALPIIVGLQFVLAFIGYDIAQVPRRPRHRSFLKDNCTPFGINSELD